MATACSGTSSPSPVTLTGRPPGPPSAALTAAVAPAVVSDYSRRNNAVLAKLEAALKAGDNAGAVKLVADLNGLQRTDHKEFRRPQE